MDNDKLWEAFLADQKEKQDKMTALEEDNKRLRKNVNFLLNKIYEAGDLLDEGELTDASNKLDDAKFNVDLEKEID